MLQVGAPRARIGTPGLFGVAAVPWIIGGVTQVAAAILPVTTALAGRASRQAGSPLEPAGFIRWLTAACSGVALLAVL